jgi:hypothetical protein
MPLFCRLCRLAFAVLAVLAWGACQPSSRIMAQDGRTLVVDPGGSDDGGDGSAENPWATIQRAADEAGLGDTVLINPGTYEGGITVRTGGEEGRPVTFRAAGPGVVIEGSGAERDGFFIDQADEVVVEGLTIQGAERAGLRVSLANGVTVRDSVFLDNGTWGIFTDFTDDLLLEGNETAGSGEEHGIYVSNSSDRPIIRGNLVHDNAASGIQINADASMGGDGISSEPLIEDNVVFGNGELGGAAINLDGAVDGVIRNNLLYDNLGSGIALFQDGGAVCSSNNLVERNTILMPADGRWGVVISPSADCADNRLLNNVILSEHDFRGSVSIPVPDLSGFESDRNLVSDRFSTDDGETVITLSDWQDLGYDASSELASAGDLFVDPEAGDFQLQEGVAIDAGAVIGPGSSPASPPEEDAGGAPPEEATGEATPPADDPGEPTEPEDGTDEAPPSSTDDAELGVALSERDGSGVSGLAILTPQDDSTAVTLLLQGGTTDQVALIHRGSCEALDPDPLFLLSQPDAAGRSESIVNVGLAELQGGGYAIAVHASAAELGVVVACGEIPAA